METAHLLNRLVSNQAVIEEEENGYGSSLTQTSHSTYMSDEALAIIKKLSIEEVIS